MAEFDSPTYYLDLKDKSTRSRIQTARPGGKPVQVRVRSEEDPKAQPLVAEGTLNLDSTEFKVVVKTHEGEQAHVRDWTELRKAIDAFGEE